jgi:hypothetical protein
MPETGLFDLSQVGMAPVLVLQRRQRPRTTSWAQTFNAADYLANPSSRELLAASAIHRRRRWAVACRRGTLQLRGLVPRLDRQGPDRSVRQRAHPDLGGFHCCRLRQRNPSHYSSRDSCWPDHGPFAENF